MTTIFVFGSNLRGIHGAGAAKHARSNYGAKLGIAIGRTGNAYAIPTKRNPTMKKEDILPLSHIANSVASFIGYARVHPELTFLVTRIGCGLAGYTDSQIAPLFKNPPTNCIFDELWHPYL